MKLTISSLLLTLCLLTCTANSVEVTTGNLLPNSNDGVDWNSSSTDQINPGGSGYVTSGSTVNGFDVTCTNQSNCGYKYSVGGDFEVTGDTTLSVEDVGLTNNSITQSMLDNGVTLNSYIDVANCESTEGNCESKGGSNDTHTTTIILKDSSGNVLSTTTQTRNEVTGFKGNCNGYPGSSATGVTAACGQYNDTVTHNDVGANKFNWSWQGVDSNYTNQSRQGPNLLGARVTMTYNNTEYDPIDEDAQEAIDDIDENIPDIEDDFTWEEEFTFEDDYFTWEEDFNMDWENEYIVGDWEMDYEMEFNEDMYFEEEFVEMEMPEEFEEFDMTMMPEEEFVDMYFEEEFDEGAFMEMPEEFEEMEIEEEFTEMEMEEEFEEMEVMEEEPTEMEVVEEEETIDMETETEEDVVEMEAEEEEMEVAENDDSIQEPKEDEESSEGNEEALEEESGSEESVSETASNEEESVEETDVADKGGITTKNIEVSKEIKIKNVDVGEIKISIDPRDIFKEVVNLDSYSNKDFYQDKGLQYDVNDDFFDQLSMIEYSKEIYKGITLVTYIQGDPIEIYKQELEELAIQKAGIMIELKLLRGE